MKRSLTHSSTGPYVPNRLASSSPHPRDGTFRTMRYLKSTNEHHKRHDLRRNPSPKTSEIGVAQDTKKKKKDWIGSDGKERKGWVRVGGGTWTRRRLCRRARRSARRGRAASRRAGCNKRDENLLVGSKRVLGAGGAESGSCLLVAFSGRKEEEEARGKMGNPRGYYSHFFSSPPSISTA